MKRLAYLEEWALRLPGPANAISLANRRTAALSLAKVVQGPAMLATLPSQAAKPVGKNNA
jgi:hypothetical protein